MIVTEEMKGGRETDSLDFSLNISRDVYPLNPSEVRSSKLQYAGWGPKDQQLVSRRPFSAQTKQPSIRQTPFPRTKTNS